MEEFKDIRFAGEEIADVTKVTGIAYAGGVISQWGERVVIDVAGVEFSPQVVMLYSHTNDPKFRLGIWEKVEKTAGGISCSGSIDTAGELGRRIVEQGKKYAWQLSVGCTECRGEMLRQGATEEVNGAEVEGPCFIVRSCKLREISVVALGADDATSMSIAAKLAMNAEESTKEPINHQPKESEMDKEIQARADTSATNAAVIEAREAEMNRIAAISAACDGYPEYRDEAIKAGYGIDEVKRTVATLKAQAAKFGESGANLIIKSQPQVTSDAISAALCETYGINAKASEQTMDAAQSIHGITLRGAIELACKQEGKTTSAVFGNDTIKAAMSTANLPGILGNVADKAMLLGFQAHTPIATKLCRAGNLSDFKQAERYGLNVGGELPEVPEGGEIPHGSLGEDKAVNQLKTYGEIIEISRQMIYNDDLGAMLTIARAMGVKAALKIDQLFHRILLTNGAFTDGKALFHADHRNLKTGSGSALGVASLKAARAAFMKQVNSDGMPINVAPKFLLVPSELDGLARELVMARTIIGASEVTANFNAGSTYGLEVVESPYLSNPAFTGNSSAAWYLFADPAIADTFEIGYLGGRTRPTVESMDANFNTLGFQTRVYFDCGVAPLSYQSVLKNVGA